MAEPNPSRLRAAVIGLGAMGMHHVRAHSDLVDVDLIGVLDHKSDWAADVAKEYDCQVFANPEDLIGAADMAVVAVPTCDHAAVAVPLLRAGLSCLIEKPIAATEAEAETLHEAASESSAVLQVGHIERYNPAVIALNQALRHGGPVASIRTRRLNRANGRNLDVDVVLDLMIHDLDVVLSLAPNGALPEDITAHGTSDEIDAILTWADGLTANLAASRQAGDQTRDIEVMTDTTTYRADYAARSLELLSGNHIEAVDIPSHDPLRSQLRAFAAAVKNGTAATVGSDAGLRALKLANRVRAAAGLAT